jgi:hypothetical protein
MFYKLHRSFVSIALLGMIILGLPIVHIMVLAASPSIAQSQPQSQCELVVLADSDDPYYPLAKEIATSEDAPIVHSLPDAIACHPTFLLWVVSPTSLSDAVMIEFGQTMKEQSSAISSGIITASTLEQARGLWERRTQVRGQSLFAVNAPNPSALIYEGQITAFAHEQTATHPLTKTGFENALQAADYLTFTGHGGNKYLKLDESTEITSVDIPSLDAIAISTGSCQTFRLWNQDSIARRFVDQGAAAYSGFVFSPIEGYLIGEFDGLPFRYTWQDFPIGHVIQVQNRGTLQGFAQFPYQYLLGDPRIALQTDPPYRLVDDRREGERRILTFQDVPPGVIPIRISNGAAYRFVEVPGVTAAAEQDPFYNSRLQMVNIQNDKFILLVHEGGELNLRMRPQAPWYWFLGDILLDSLDHTFIFVGQQAGGDIIAIVFAVIPLVWAGWQIVGKRLGWQEIRLAMVIGIGAIILQGVYVFARLDQVTIISKAVVFSPLSIVAAFALSMCGALIHLQARSQIGKVIGLFVMTSVSWISMVFGLVLVAAFNAFVFIPETGTALYNYSLGLLSACSFLFTFTLSGLVLWYINTLIRRNSHLCGKRV